MSKPKKSNRKQNKKPASASLATFLVRLWPSQAKAVRAAAGKRGVSLSEFLRTAIIRSAAGSVSVPECPKIKRGQRVGAPVASKPKAKKAARKAAKKAAPKPKKRSHHKKPAPVASVAKPAAVPASPVKEAANG